ncbi:MAG: AEC family transporter [Kangiellaceae bacterium]|jgi:predicted permease|nr:AEC family transporter [Kangiellaceae bacterium]
MTTLIYAIVPLLLLIALGYLLSYVKIINRSQLDGLSKLTFIIFIPSLLFISTYQGKSTQGLSVELLAAFYLPLVLLFFISYAIFRFIAKRQFPKTELLCLASTFSNNVLIGIPILLVLVGEEILLPGFFIVSFHSLLLFSLTTLSSGFSNKTQVSWYRSLASSIWITTRSPIVISLLCGLSLKYFNVELPYLIEQPIVIAKQAALPCALVVLGATLGNYRVTGNLDITLFVSILKLLVLPAMIWFSGVWLFNLPTIYVQIAVIMSASPVGLNVFMFAVQDKQASPYLASTILVSTIMSVLTLPIWLYITGLAR